MDPTTPAGGVPPDPRSSRRLAWVAVGFAVVVTVVGVAVAVNRSAPTEDRIVAVGDEAVDGTDGSAVPVVDPFAAFAPGWSTVDGVAAHGPERVGLAWTGTEVVVNHRRDVLAFDPAAGTWRTLPSLPFDTDGAVAVVGADGVLVAVSTGATEASDPAAMLAPGTDAWTVLPSPPIAPGLAQLVSGGPRGMGPGPGLVWTGERVVDLTHGAVLDPTSGSWSVLPLPADVVPYTPLLGATPVWDGDELVLVAWTDRPGLAWDATASTFREVPGLPTELLDRPPYVQPSLAVSAGDGTVTLVSSDPSRNSATLVAATGTWSPLPTVPGVSSMEGCPQQAAVVASVLVVAGCGSGSTEVVALVDGAWAPTGAQLDPLHGATTWLVADGALVTWTTTAREGAPAAPPDVRVWRPA